MFKMGFTLQDLYRIRNIKHEMDQELWNVIKTDRMSDAAKSEKYLLTIHRFMKIELKLIEELVTQHGRDKIPIVPLKINNSQPNDQNMSVFLDLKHLIAWKQHEAKLLYLKRIYHEGSLDLKGVDWLMVEKDVVRTFDSISNDFLIFICQSIIQNCVPLCSLC